MSEKKSFIKTKHRGLMLVISSPSGAGKTSIAKALLANDDNLEMSISATTRPPRPGEINGKDYYFMETEEFQSKISDGAFLEYAQVFDNSYGTPRDAVEKTLSQGRDMLFDIDWQGTQQLRQNARSDMASIFILPPSLEELERRLINRGQDDPAIIQKRMAKASDEMSHWPEYDYVVINDDRDRCLANIEAILHAERLRRDRQIDLTDFVRGLRGQT
jgi:guanylate kinase